MGLFNLGKKDRYGKQRRVEHRGKYLRASRTGGVALRAQAKAAGVSLTANTQRGTRASVTPVKNTQVALQNGRFILRGRYGKGPTKLNVSKSGATVSTRNRLGSFNWLKPQRSSAKLLGVQVRGQKAAYLQAVYMLFAGAVGAVRLLLQLLAALIRGGIALVQGLGDAVRAFRRWRRNARLRRQRKRLGKDLEQAVKGWDADRLAAAFALAVAVWGRGEALEDQVQRVARRLSETKGLEAVPRSSELLAEAAQALERCRAEVTPQKEAHRILVVLLAEAAAQQMDGPRRAALLFEADDLALACGPRTVLQEQLLEIFADHAQLRVEPAETATQGAERSAQGAERRTPGRAGASGGGEPRIDLNSASVEALQEIPNIGPERAEAIAAMRPIQRIEQLEAVDGIGPERLEEIATRAKV